MPKRPAPALLRTALVGFALTLLATGCGARHEPDGATVSQYPLTVRDSSGAHVSLSRQPLRILALDPAAARTLLDLGAPSVVSSSLPPGKLPAAAKRGAFDLIVASVGDDDNDVAAVSKAVGAPTYRYGASTIPSLPAAIAQLGTAIGRGPAGVVEASRARAAIARVVASVAAKPRVRVLLDGGSFLAYGPETAAGRVIAFAGGANVVHSSRQLKASDIRSLAPAVWVLLPGVRTDPRELANVPGAAKVPAIANKRYVRLKNLPLVSTPEVGDALTDIIRELHGGAG